MPLLAWLCRECMPMKGEQVASSVLGEMLPLAGQGTAGPNLLEVPRLLLVAGLPGAKALDCDRLGDSRLFFQFPQRCLGCRLARLDASFDELDTSHRMREDEDLDSLD